MPHTHKNLKHEQMRCNLYGFYLALQGFVNETWLLNRPLKGAVAPSIIPHIDMSITAVTFITYWMQEDIKFVPIHDVHVVMLFSVYTIFLLILF